MENIKYNKTEGQTFALFLRLMLLLFNNFYARRNQCCAQSHRFVLTLQTGGTYNYEIQRLWIM